MVKDITDRIIAVIEAGAGRWQMHWHKGSGDIPRSTSNKHYPGVQMLGLPVEAQVHGYRKGDRCARPVRRLSHAACSSDKLWTIYFA